MNEASSSSDSKRPVQPQSNFRFQRRQSERAFYEGALRDGGIPGDMEYPAGSGIGGQSPWASSPEASRQTFGGNISQENLPEPAVEGQVGGSGDGEGLNGSGEERGPQYGYHGDLESSPQQQQSQQQWQGRQQQQQQGQGQGEEQRRSRYHGASQQHPQSRQQQPQYKLQAKITGLERSGKKDPILRFDVYVSIAYVHQRTTNDC